jgi:hypothetical protein
MTNAETYTEIVKEQEIKSVTVYLFYETEMTFKQVFNCEKEAEEFGKAAYDVLTTAKKNGKRCANGLPFEGMLEDNYKYLFVYEW